MDVESPFLETSDGGGLLSVAANMSSPILFMMGPGWTIVIIMSVIWLMKGWNTKYWFWTTLLAMAAGFVVFNKVYMVAAPIALSVAGPPGADLLW